MKAQSRAAPITIRVAACRIRGLVSILVPLFISSFRRADDLAVAMEARCYRGGAARTRLHTLKLSVIDVIFSVILIILLLLVIVVEPYLPPLIAV